MFATVASGAQQTTTTTEGEMEINLTVKLWRWVFWFRVGFWLESVQGHRERQHGELVRVRRSHRKKRYRWRA